MPTIYHQAGIAGTPEQIFTALTTTSELAAWWTRDTRGNCEAGGLIEFYFGKLRMGMQVIETTANKRVRWRSISGDGEWQDTKIVFELCPDANQTLVNFSHENWADVTDLFRHCSTKWAVFLLSLKDYIETGEGRPYPDDIQINHW